jgi:hypothetical protein
MNYTDPSNINVEANAAQFQIAGAQFINGLGGWSMMDSAAPQNWGHNTFGGETKYQTGDIGTGPMIDEELQMSFPQRVSTASFPHIPSERITDTDMLLLYHTMYLLVDGSAFE